MVNIVKTTSLKNCNIFAQTMVNAISIINETLFFSIFSGDCLNSASFALFCSKFYRGPRDREPLQVRRWAMARLAGTLLTLHGHR